MHNFGSLLRDAHSRIFVSLLVLLLGSSFVVVKLTLTHDFFEDLFANFGCLSILRLSTALQRRNDSLEFAARQTLTRLALRLSERLLLLPQA